MSTANQRKRVVITGLGTTNPVGGDVATTWDALVKGQSGVRRIEQPWVEELPVKIAGVAAVEPTEVLERVKARRLDRTSQFGMVAAMEAWQDAGLPRIRVSVNLSSRQLKRTLAETVGRALQISGLEARYLSLELTESVLVNYHREGTEALHALRAMGLHLAVDDFGTGYSSFSYLKHFPLDTLKIDRSFIREIAIQPDDAAITTAIIAMGHALGLRVIAEGVETEAHLTLLQKQGCDEVQGYLIGRPVPPGKFVDHLTRKRSGPVTPGVRRQRSVR